MILRFYTDGSSIPTDNTYSEYVGAFSVVMVRDASVEDVQSGALVGCTNNQAEILGVINAVVGSINHLSNEGSYGDIKKVFVHTDSTYVLGHYEKMRKGNSYDSSQDIPNIKNLVVLQNFLNDFERLFPEVLLAFVKVKAHDTNRYNNMADEVAKGSCRKYLRELKFKENKKMK